MGISQSNYDLWNKRNLIIGLLFFTVVMAVALRIWGIRFGLPYRYHIDETFYVALSLKLPTSRFDIPIKTHGPNLFYMVLLLEYVAYFIISLVIGRVDSITQFEALYRSDPTIFVLLARLTSVIAGVATLVPVFLIGRKIVNRTVGLLAAIILAATFQHVRESHYGTPDMLAAFLFTCSILFCLELQQNRQARNYLLAGLFAGLATGTKFTNILLWVPLSIAHITSLSEPLGHSVRRVARKLINSAIFVAMGGFVLGFAFAYPNTILRPARLYEYVSYLVDVGRNGFIPQFVIEPAPAWYYYLYSLTWGYGWILLILALFGLPLMLTKHRRIGLILVSSVIANYLILSRAPYYASRYLGSMIPIMCVSAAVAIYWIAKSIGKTVKLRREIVLAIIVVVALFQPLSSAIRHNILLTRIDTRTEAVAWMEENIAPGKLLALDWRRHGPPIRFSNGGDLSEDELWEVIDAGGIGLPEHTISEYHQLGVDYLIMSSYIDDLPISSLGGQEKKQHLLDSLEDYEIVYEVTPYVGDKPRHVFDQMYGPVTSLWRLRRPGPTIKIYDISRQHDDEQA